MKSGFAIPRLGFVAVAGILLTGCLLNRATVSTRHFILAPIATNEPASAATEHLSVGIGFVKMPSYLLRNSMAVRNRTNEIEYLEDALWGERLDQCFQRTVAANLSRLLSSDSIYLTDWGHDQVMVRVFISVQQFDVDTGGTGTLIAQWRTAAPDSDMPLKSGYARLVRTGASPRGNPEVIATTLSDVAAEFSRDLAVSIRESVKFSPSGIQSEGKQALPAVGD
ncbi:MAG TPA: PqiC family protein [Verrucomicrobiae bacterium]|nr:PqiC family protein [Verrucomicrobiae bacterium]